MYECDRCNHRFNVFDIVTEPHGEKVACCPFCHGSFEEIKQCKICGDWYAEDDMTSDVCDECIYSHENDIELCYKFGEVAKEAVSINGFIASVFTEEQIAEILMKELRIAKEIGQVSCIEFIGSDKSWFAEKLIEGDVVNG